MYVKGELGEEQVIGLFVIKFMDIAQHLSYTGKP